MIQLCLARFSAAAIYGTDAKFAAGIHAAGATAIAPATAIAADAGRVY